MRVSRLRLTGVLVAVIMSASTPGAAAGGPIDLAPAVLTAGTTSFRFGTMPAQESASGSTGTDATVTGTATGASGSDSSAAAAPRLDASHGSENAPFGAAGSWRWFLQGGGGTAFDDGNQALFGGGVSWFFIENLSFDMELNGVYYDNEGGTDSWAVGPTLIFRWHFLARERWSIYVDGGAGFQYATNPTPPDGARFAFTPQVGGGVSFEVAHNVRMLIGVRWRHVSNADLYPQNTGLDSIFAYAQVSFPF